MSSAAMPTAPPMRRRRSTFTAAMEGIGDSGVASDAPMDPTVATFLQELLGGKEYAELEAVKLTIRNPSALKAVFSQIVGALAEDAQIQALEALINLVRCNCSNVEACSSFGLQREVLAFLSDRGLFADPFVSNQVLKKILRLFLYLANHSVTSEDVRAMLGVFRSARIMSEDPNDQAMSYYVATLEMIARDSFGPVSFFDLSGEYSGLVVPVLEAFPTTGYTFCAWIKFESLPETSAPLFTFCGKSDVGVMASFIRSSLAITCFDKKKNDSHVEIPDLITPGRWHFLSIVHTHRQIRGSKVDVYMNSELRHSTKLTYPNTAFMAPVVKSYIAMRERDRNPSLRVLLGPMALFGQALPSNIIASVKSAEEYDALVFQFNAYISSSTSSGAGSNAAVPGSIGATPPSGVGDGLLFAYDARNCDRHRGVCFDSSGNDNHAEAASRGVRLRRTATFKQSVAQLGGPLVCLPLLVTATNTTSLPHGELAPVGSVTAQFDEDSEFLLQMADMLARPLGIRTIPKVLLLIAEIMRHSLVNKFIFRRHQGVRLTALLLRSLPPRYLTPDLLVSIERFRSAVISDRTLSEEIYKFLLFNFRIWVNAPNELQHTVFNKLEIVTRKEAATSSAVSTRHFLRCLSWIYWKYPNGTLLRRAREYSEEDIDSLRRRVLAIIKLELCEAQPIRTSVIGRGIRGKEVQSQLSYESTRSLIFCMIGKPTNPMSSGLNSDGTSSLQDSGGIPGSMKEAKKLSDGEADAGSVVENVPELDLPDLIALLIELSVQPTAPAGLLDLFGRLGGLRIWLPLLNFSSNALRVMTLRLLRTYLTLKCQCSQERDKVTNPDKTQLSVGDAYLIMNAVNTAGHPVTMGVYSEVLLTVLGIQVKESDMTAPGWVTRDDNDCDSFIDEDMLSNAMVWHSFMMFPFLEMVRCSSPSIRLVAIRHLKIIFASSTPASAINRNMLIYNSISTSGALTVSSTTEQTPIIEAILSLRGGDSASSNDKTKLPSILYGITLEECRGVPMSRLREMVLNPEESDEVRVNALFTIVVSMDDAEFVSSLFTVHSDGERKKNSHGETFQKMPKRVKMAAIDMMACVQPASCSQFITQTAYELISSIITLEAKSNDVSWILLQDPFTSLSRFIDSSAELEVVVVSLLKATLDKMNELLSVEINLRGKDDIPSRDSVLWRNAENLATLSAAVVLHYDPDTLGDVNPAALDSTAVQSKSVYWKCERMLWHEAELVDAILGVWQHLASYFHSEKDASFGRKPVRSNLSIGQASWTSGDSNTNGNGSQSPPSKNGSSRGLGFGFNLLPVPGVGTSGGGGGSGQGPQGSVSMRPHPGGPMRQVLQLLLRSFYIILTIDDESGGKTVADIRDPNSSRMKLQGSAMFFARINKLEYFANAMGLGRDMTQFESSFTPSRSSSTTNIGIGGLVTVSRHIKAAPGDETSLLLWFVPELSSLISRVRRKLWPDSAIKLAGILAGLVARPLRSSEELSSLLSQNDFSSNNQEVCRRDGFYFEQMAHARESRAARRAAMLSHEVEEKSRAAAELERISKSTRTQTSANGDGEVKGDGSGDCVQDQDSNAVATQVWLQRVKAKDIDDWMRLRVLLQWGIRHVWANASVSDSASDISSGALGPVNPLGEALSKNEFWRLDQYTSSNWIRCRLLPDTDDTMAAYAEYVKSSALNGSVTTETPDSIDALTVSSVDAIKDADSNMQDDGTDLADQADDGEYDDDEDEDELNDTVMDLVDEHTNEGSGSGGEQYGDADAMAGVDAPVVAVRGRQGSIMGSDSMPIPSTIEKIPLQRTDSKTEVSVSDDTSQTGNRPDLTADTTPDVTNSVKVAKDKFPRIGNISSRFSNSIRMFSGRPGSKSGEDFFVDATAAAAAAAGPPAIERKQSGKVTQQAGDRVSQTSETTTTSEATSDPSPVNTSKPGPAVAPPTRKRLLRSFSSRSEQWKSLSSTYRTKAYLILPSGQMVYGILRIGSTTIVFEGEYVTTLQTLTELKEGDSSRPMVHFLGDAFVSELKRRVWGVRVIRVIHRRRFLLNTQSGIELYFVDGSSCLFGLEGKKEADLVYATLKERKPPCLAKWGKRLLSADRMFGKSKWTEMWARREISNFEYLMLLNVAAGRSYNDLAQYPVFPWVLRDYESNALSLDDPSVFRDLSKPIGGQTEAGRESARELFQKCEEDQPQLPPYHFPTSYSHVRSVYYFMSRVAPITGAFAIDGQSISDVLASGPGVFDSIHGAYQCATDQCHYELTPEFFYLADFLSGGRNKQLAKGMHEGMGGGHDGDSVSLANLRGQVKLPPWASSPHDFIHQHRLALESDYVSQNLHHWIDLIFGYQQSGKAAVKAENVYHIGCQPERLDLRSLNVSARSRLTQRGTVPIQLFRKPHPVRLSQDGSLEARYPASHAVAALSSRRQVRRHDLASKHNSPVVSIRFSSALNSGSGMIGSGMGSGSGIGTHASGTGDHHGIVVYTSDSDGVVLAKRYLNSTPDQAKMCPFTLADVDQWWKLPSGSLGRDGVVFYEQMISCGYWDGSWRIHWSADGELLQRIAFHKKPILCMAYSEDDFTGDLALAFGSEDCTVSVWALSKMAATRSRRMFVKKELPVGGLPWVLLHGHTNPVVAVSLNVDLDVVVSSSKDNTILVHSLRSATPLHNIEIASPSRSVVTHLTISNHGDTLIHTITQPQSSGDNTPRKLSSHGMLIGGDSSQRLSLAEDDGATHVEQSDLYLVSMNGQLISHDRLVDAEDQPQILLDRAAFFTRSGEYIITATGGSDAIIEVRNAGRLSVVARRIECKRASHLTCVSISQDERCILCGYADGSVVAYALHYGIADGCKDLGGLDRKAREEVAEAMAKADKRDQLKKEAEEKKNLFKWGGAAGGESGGNGELWIRPGKISMPAEPYLSVMQSYFSLLKQPCVSEGDAYEAMLKELWLSMYDRKDSSPKNSATSGNPELLIDLSVVEGRTSDTNEYERAGPTWSHLGFQRPDPTTDFRAGGLLSLKCILYFARNYYEQASRMVAHQVPGSRDNTYPWGPAGINITCMLARLFWTFDGGLIKERCLNWEFFAEEDAFYIIFSEVFVLFDHMWEEMNAHYGVFSEVIHAMMGVVLDAMEEAKSDLQSFLVEIRAQSLSNTSRFHKGRAPSRSMEEFLVNMSSNIVNPGSSSPPPLPTTTVASSFVSVSGDFFAPSTPPGMATDKDVIFKAPPPTALVDLDTFTSSVTSTSTSTTTTTSTSATAVDSVSSADDDTEAMPLFDPFAGNDLCGQTTTVADSETDEPKAEELHDEENQDDPFAFLVT